MVREIPHTAGTVIAQEGEPGVGLFVILDGSADVTIGGRKKATLGPGDFFGEIALLDGGPRTATVTAKTDVNLFGLTEWVFRGLMMEHPSIALKTLQRWRRGCVPPPKPRRPDRSGVASLVRRRSWVTSHPTCRRWRRNVPLDAPRRTSPRRDALRDRIAERGWTVVDEPGGLAARADRGRRGAVRTRGRPRRRHPSWTRPPPPTRRSTGSSRGGPRTSTARSLRSGRTRAIATSSYVVADVTGEPATAWGDDVEVLPLEPGTGWGAARNAGLKRSRGRVVLALDGSVEADGRRARSARGRAGRSRRSVSAGRSASSTPDLREFDERTAARRSTRSRATCMAFRREILTTAGCSTRSSAGTGPRTSSTRSA